MDSLPEPLRRLVDIAAATGHGDPIQDGTVTGWAICNSQPDEAVRLQVFVDHDWVASLICDLARADLAKAGFIGGGGGFRFVIPDRFFDGESHVLRIAFEDGSPLPFQAPAGGSSFEARFRSEREIEVHGFVDGLEGSGIRGWAYRHNTRTGEITGGVTLQVACNGEPVAQITANGIRQDVAAAKHCTPQVGFDFQLPPQFRTGASFSFSLRSVPDDIEIQRSPITTSFPAADAISKLYALKDVVDDLCTRAWAVQRQIGKMLPSGGHVGNGYDAWARRYYEDLRQRTQALPPIGEHAPLISIIMPTFNPNLRDFMAAVESVRSQTYVHWQLIIVDDASRSRALNACIRDLVAHDERIETVRHSRNRGISSATNTALRRARGEYVILFDHDDLLVDVAVETMVRAASSTDAKILYSDEDKIDQAGSYSEPNLKPDWNYRLLLCQNYVCHLLMIERDLLRRAGGLRSECDGAQDHDLLLRLSEICEVDRIRHVPELLYHWRKSATSTASSGEAKPYAVHAGAEAVRGHLSRRGFASAAVLPLGRRTMFSVAWGFNAEPSVCIVIPFKDQAEVTRRCVQNVLDNTDYDNWRVVLVDNGSVTPDAKRFCKSIGRQGRVTIRRVNEKFNYSRLNNIAAAENPADFYVFLNNDVFIEQRSWLRVLVDEALADPRVAIVGAKLIYPNQTMQHAGVVLGVGGIADHVFRGLSKDDPGYVARAWCAQQYSAVTAACMLCRADAFRDVQGFDERELAVAYNDVDLCLKLGAQGWRVIWTPALTAEHHESLSRGDDMAPAKVARFFDENQTMLRRWGATLRRDPFYHPLFSRSQGIFTALEDIAVRR
jgi:O-antigen biosynthesis protein